MSVTDIGFWIATGAAVISAVYTALTYHKPNQQMTTKPTKTKSPPPSRLRPLFTVLFLLLITQSGILFDYLDRHYWSILPKAEIPLSTINARMDVRLWQPIINPDKQYAVNVYTVNNGRSAATELRHAGLMMLTTGRPPNQTLDVLFGVLRAQISASEPAPKSDIQPGQNDLWFTVFGQKLDDKQSSDISSGAVSPYVLNVMQYRDGETTPPKFIYTDSCIYLVGVVTHFCEAGHNRSYIAD